MGMGLRLKNMGFGLLVLGLRLLISGFTPIRLDLGVFGRKLDFRNLIRIFTI